jgi:tetratricopeptide (TPR) repeat protein/SAM-dependent methyltransferase
MPAARGSAANRPFGAALGDLFAGAMAQHQAGALAEAERRYRYILTLFPDHAGSLHYLGLIALQTGNAASAVEHIAKAIKLNNRVGEYHYNIALAWRALDRADQVETHLKRAIELRPDDGLAHLNLGNVRREQGRLGEAVACYERVLALDPKSAGARFNLANIMAEQGRWEAAIALYREGLALEPNIAEAHHHLGVALSAAGRPADAAPHFEKAIALRPGLAAAYEGLGAACLASGKLDVAIDAVTRALELAETPHGRALFAACVKAVRFTADNERLRNFVHRALAGGWARPRELGSVCISLIKLNPIINDCIARAVAAKPGRLDGAELFGPAGLAALAEHALFACLLQCDPVTDTGLECLLINVRHAVLSAAIDGGQAFDAPSLGFFAAVARQCFINEYVYPLPPGEADRARQLQSRLAQAIDDGEAIPSLWPIAVGAYFPLHALPGADALLERPWPDYVDALLVQQIGEPGQERQLAAAIPALTAIDSQVSLAVREQYEENPYPRWIQAGPPFHPAVLRDGPPRQTADVLIAGCGTGLSAIEFARQMRSARILAIDLSLASLSYARRMADNCGLDNIEFAQADIMQAHTIERKFDFIDASGVLHHLADPWAGWKILLTLLRTGGTMQVGLYSELARRSVVAARTLIAERGYQASADDIRRCREFIMTADDPLLKSVVQWADIYTISECRDLLFHVQEHRITLPQIKSFLAANGMQFAGFLPEPTLLRQFTARFPEHSALLDLDCWHELETEVPSLFAAMYQFWIRKPATPPDAAAETPRHG